MSTRKFDGKKQIWLICIRNFSPKFRELKNDQLRDLNPPGENMYKSSAPIGAWSGANFGHFYSAYYIKFRPKAKHFSISEDLQAYLYIMAL